MFSATKIYPCRLVHKEYFYCKYCNSIHRFPLENAEIWITDYWAKCPKCKNYMTRTLEGGAGGGGSRQWGK